MKIITLVENSAISDKFQVEHGLSLYMETDKHKILFDVGRSDLFVDNARKLNVPLDEVDILIISHGHHDHGGGLPAFWKINDKARVYAHKLAFEPHFAMGADNKTRFVGLDPGWALKERITWVDGYLRIDEQLELFGDVSARKFHSTANDILFMQHDGGPLQRDTFRHEQNLIITGENGARVLVAGCAHNGIVNIVTRFMEIKGAVPEVALAGFHLMIPDSGQTQPAALLDSIAHWLLSRPVRYYTGHCTGKQAFDHLKAIMRDKLDYLATGRQLEF